MTVVQRLSILIATVVLGLCALAGVGVYQTEKVYTTTNYSNVNVVPSVLKLDQAFQSLAQLCSQLWEYLALTDPARIAEWES